ncbi:MAG: 50S ribosomal protein L18 [Planctomycetota bacterium]
MANLTKLKAVRYARRKKSVRRDLFGTNERPRMSVFRTAKHIYVQIVNDFDGKTLVSSSTLAKDLKGTLKNGGNCEAAKLVGENIAEKALAAGVKSVVFDRNGFRYHGRLKALADAAREKGLDF